VIRTISAALLALCLVALITASPVAAQPAAPSLVGPDVAFSTYYGGPGDECMLYRCKVAVDAQGHIYLAGTTNSASFPVVRPLFTRSNGIFVVKLAPGGASVIYSTYIASGVAFGVAADAAGRVYVTGLTNDTSFPVTPNALQSTNSGVDAFLAVLSPDGQQLVYGSYLGGSGSDEGHDVALDAAGNIYLTGYTESTNFPVRNAVQGTFGGLRDAFVTRINSNFTLSYSTYLGGTRDDRGWGIAVDDLGNAFIVGFSNSDNFPVTAGALQTVRFSGAGSDAVVAGFRPNGTRIYSTFFNRSSSNAGIDVATDGSGAAYVVTTREGVIRLNPSGSALTYQVKPQLDVNVTGEGGIAVDTAGNAYAVGRTGPSGNREMRLVIIGPGGGQIGERTWGGSGDDWATGIAVRTLSGCAATAFIAGTSRSANYPTTPGSIQPASGGAADVVLTSLYPLPSCTVHLPLITR
jgi:hypothetical protein